MVRRTRKRGRRGRKKSRRRMHRRNKKRHTRRKRGGGLIANLGEKVIKVSNKAMSLTPQGQVNKMSKNLLCKRKNPPAVCKNMMLTPKQRAQIVEQKLGGGIV